MVLKKQSSVSCIKTELSEYCCHHALLQGIIKLCELFFWKPDNQGLEERKGGSVLFVSKVNVCDHSGSTYQNQKASSPA